MTSTLTPSTTGDGSNGDKRAPSSDDPVQDAASDRVSAWWLVGAFVGVSVAVLAACSGIPN